MFNNLLKKQALSILTKSMKDGGFNSVFFYEDPTNLETGFTFEFYETEKPVMVIPKTDVDYIKNQLNVLRDENTLLKLSTDGELIKKHEELILIQKENVLEIQQLKQLISDLQNKLINNQ